MSSTVAVKAFAEGVTQQIKDYLPEDYQDMECEILEQQKNNGVVLTGMILNMPGQQIAPVVYMEPFYDQVRKGEPMDQIMDRIADVCRQSLSVRELPETLDFTDYDSVKDHLTVQVPYRLSIRKRISGCYPRFRISKWKTCLSSVGLNSLRPPGRELGVSK